MDWLFLLFMVMFVLLIVVIIVFLITLFKQGDERYEHVKTKAMATSFYGAVGLIILKFFQAIFSNNQTSNALSYLSMLTAIAVVFLAALIWEKRKYGG